MGVLGLVVIADGLLRHYVHSVHEVWRQCIESVPPTLEYPGEGPEFLTETTWFPLGHTCNYFQETGDPIVVTVSNWNLTWEVLLGIASLGLAACLLFLAIQSRRRTALNAARAQRVRAVDPR